MMDDLISRQAAITALSHMCSEDEKGITVSRANVDSMLKPLLPAQPEQNTALWIIRKWGSDAKCSNCGKTFSESTTWIITTGFADSAEVRWKE